MSERIEYYEFALFHENASEFGLVLSQPPIVRREFVEVEPGRQLSALKWGEAEPEFVFVHGGAQNAHTWDTVALALGRPLVAIDLPGHGHSDAGGGIDGSLSIDGNAGDVEQVIRQLAPNAIAVIGMSLGGLTSIALAGRAPDLVRRLILVDVTPGVNPTKSQAISNFVNGPKTFPSFEEILARTVEHNSTRTVASLRRGILHNALQLEDGSWVWRYRRFDGPALGDGSTDPQSRFRQFTTLWDIVSALTMPVMLMRGMLPQSVVDDDDENELRRRCPQARIEHIANAGHSVQGDTPLELARLLIDFCGQ